MEKITVLIAGGGPAGAAAALSLQKRGIGCMVAEALPEPVGKVGETIPPNALPLLRRIGIDMLLQREEHLVCHGNRFVWGSEQPADKAFLYHTHAVGYHLDRAQFEKDLRSHAVSEGIAWRNGWRIASFSRGGAGWDVVLQDATGTKQQLHCDFLVDATGRASRITRTLGVRRISLDKLTGITAILPAGGNPPMHYTFIEAVKDGWWYAAPLANGSFVVSYMTDADLVNTNVTNELYYCDALRATTMLSSILHPQAISEDIHLSVATAATSYLSKRYGQSWLATGDAAFAYDPISSYGITSAVESGYYAGHAIADYLGGHEEALPAYDYLIAQAFRVYADMHKHQYMQEQRWPDQPFWKRRIDAN